MTTTAPCPDCRRPYTVNGDGAVRRHGCKAAPVGEVALPWTRPPLSLNDRRNWQVQWRDSQQAKTEARWAIRAARPTPADRAEVTLHWRVADNRARDLDNLFATFKPVADALVAEGVLPSDDFRHLVAAETRIHPPEPKMPAVMWLAIRRIT